MKKVRIPPSFILRRIQSLMGLFFVLFLFEHLLINSQAALFFHDESLFVKSVNFLQSLPYLHFMEVFLIGLPIFFHASLGVKYILSGENNAIKTDGKTPSLKMYTRNKAYVWQRITSYIILVFLVFHVAQMRFFKHPKKVVYNNTIQYVVKINHDEKLEKIANKIDAKIFYKNNIPKVLEGYSLKSNTVLAMTKTSGAAILLMVRDTFQNPFMIAGYTAFVLAATFHAINGLWSFLITWGVILSYKSQNFTLKICRLIMIGVVVLGFLSIFGNLFLR
ncbi:MAG: hypothetical protein JXA94_06215 [Parachlamydiales bacterium]|nr:hypothetical protein [Parachlamydiales bacterium]